MDTLQFETTESMHDTVMLNYTLKKLDTVKQDLESENHLLTAISFMELAAIVLVAILFYSKKQIK
jgi:hypothetical protein